MFIFRDEILIKVIFGMVLGLIFLGLSPIKDDRVDGTVEIIVIKTRRFLMFAITGLSFLVTALLWYFFKNKDVGLIEYLLFKIEQNMLPIIMMIAGTLMVKIIYYRYWKVTWSNIKKKFHVQVGTEKLSDIKETLGKYVAPKYNPLDYIDLNKGIFVGIDAKTSEPIYIPIDEFKECHKEIIGASRSGKGVAACYIAYQKILLGWAEFYIDPKPDKFVPRVLYKACKKAGKKLFIIDLVDGKMSQYAPFRGGTLKDIKARVKQVFKIRRTGGDADFYKGQEINLVDEALTNTKRGTQDIYEYFRNNRIQEEVATGIEDVFKELIDIEQIICSNGSKPRKGTDQSHLYPAQPFNRYPGGLSIARAIMENQVVYIRGDTVDLNIRSLVKLVLTEITQEVKRLYPLRGDENHVSIDMDEGKFVMSEILSDSMATIAGFACDMTVQYQALEDIETSIEKDIDMKALAAALHINTQIKLIHGGMAPRTAEYLEEQTGKVIKKITAMDRVDTKELGAEQWTGEKMMRDQEEALLTQNDFLAMGKLTFALLERGKLARIAYSSFVDVTDEPTYPEILKQV